MTKTQFIRFDGSRQLAGVDLRLLAETITRLAFSVIFRDLCVTFDQEFSLSQHVNMVTRSCNY